MVRMAHRSLSKNSISFILENIHFTMAKIILLSINLMGQKEQRTSKLEIKIQQ